MTLYKSLSVGFGAGVLVAYEVVQYPSSFSFPRMLGQLVAPSSFVVREWASLETMISLEALVGVVDLMR